MAFLIQIARRRPGLARFLLAGLLAALPVRLPAAGAAPAPEYQVKAAFLFNFAQFVEWPAESFPEVHSPLVIGIAGEDPFGPFLDGLVRGEKIGQHPIVVRRVKEGDDLGGLHLLFIRASPPAQQRAWLARAKGRGLLTVGDGDSFCRRGGMVRFVKENGKIRLRINTDGAREAGLTISSKLLRWATIVTPDKD